MDNQKTGAFIAAKRKEQNITQKELAERIGVTNKAVSRWETGKGFPDVSVLKPLSEALNVTITELINGESSVPETVQEQSDNAILETIAYSKSMSRKTISMLLLLAGLLLMGTSLVLVGRRSLFLPALGVFTAAAGILILFSKHTFPKFKITIFPKHAQLAVGILLTTALILESIPGGVVMTFAPGPGETLQVPASYFDLLPFGYGNFFPLITSVLTAADALGIWILAFQKRDLPHFQNALFLCCIFTLVCSLLPFVFGITLIGAFISLCLLAAAIFQAAANRKIKR